MLITCLPSTRIDSANAHVDLGNVYLKLGYPAVALPFYDRALAINPRLAETHFNRGLALIALGRVQEARGEYTLLVQLRPSLAAQLYPELARTGERP